MSQTVDKEEFDQACQAVATITDHLGPLLAAGFGGATFFADEKDEQVLADEISNAGEYL